MRTKIQYIVFFTALLLSIAALLFVVFQKHKLYFILSEAILLGLVILGWKIYSNIFRPLDFIKQGSEALLAEDFNIRIATSGTSEINSLVEVYNKMLEKIRHERTYQQEQHFFLESLLEMMPVGILIMDYDQGINTFNTPAAKLLKINHSSVGERLNPEHNTLQKALHELEPNESIKVRSGSVESYRCTAKRFIHRGFPRMYYVIEDITKDLIQNEKNAYGKVIRMMAHEVNNSTGAINSILHSLLSDEDINPEEIRTYLPIVIERNQHLGQFMKNFASVIRLPDPEPKQFDLIQSIHHVIGLFSKSAKEQQIELISGGLTDTFLITADKEQIEQALVNIIKNSIEAIGTEGQIRFELDPSSGKLYITDTGSGISSTVAQHLFTPFYSSKATGQGVGLTLIKHILFSHGFPFRLFTRENETIFEIQFRPSIHK